MTTQPKIAFCIPTYNRARYLDRLLSELAKFTTCNISFEIIVSDNHSTDNTVEIVEKHRSVGLPIRYFRHENTLPVEHNRINVLHRAQAEYAMIVADDDLIIPEKVAEIIAILDSRPDLAACYAPYEWYDDINSNCLSVVYTVERDKEFGSGDFLEFFNFLVSANIILETAIFRSEAMLQTNEPSVFTFVLYSQLIHLLTHGRILITNKPFYRFVAATPIEPKREQLGHLLTLTEWDCYRGGLEYFLYAGIRKHKTNIDERLSTLLAVILNKYLIQRMLVALHLWIRQDNQINAYSLYCRINFLLEITPNTAAGRQQLQAHKPDMDKLIAEKIVHLHQSISGIKTLEIRGFEKPEYLANLLFRKGLPEKINAYATKKNYPIPTNTDETLIITIDNDCRSSVVASGHPPGLTISLESLKSQLYIDECSSTFH